MAPAEGQNVRNKLITITLAVIFMIKILTSSQLYRLQSYCYRATNINLFIWTDK